jgi:hypothetical protein
MIDNLRNRTYTSVRQDFCLTGRLALITVWVVVLDEVVEVSRFNGAVFSLKCLLVRRS